MGTRKLAQVLCSLILGALFLTVATFLTPLAEAQGPRPRTPEQLRLVAELEQARIRAGLPAVTATGPFVGPPQPVRHFVGEVQVTKAELQASLQKAITSEQSYLLSLQQQGLAETARNIRARYADQQQRIDSLPDRGITLNVPGIEVGTHSILFSTMTYDTFNAKDPTNLIFWRVGASWFVQYYLQNWTSKKWLNTSCGSWQRVYVWDSMHSGGWDGWRDMDYQLEPTGSGSCGSPRDHLRLFGYYLQDTHTPGFGWWSVGAVHHDNQWHQCTDDWDGAESRVANSFRDAQGNYLWFVHSIWQAYFGNPGTFQCAYNDGNGTYIEVTSY